MDDLISRQAVRHALCKAVHKGEDIPCENQTASCLWTGTRVCDYVREIDALPTAQPDHNADIGKKAERTDETAQNVQNEDLISRKWLMECIEEGWVKFDTAKDCNRMMHLVRDIAPSVQPEKEIAKRVLWTGWKGCRDTRYKCPNCKKPVKNDDIYCHRCGQKLMFPHISFTDYIPGEKQETIVRWDDE